jgi:riboflavin kinase/FMN adenylyltransferase
LGHPYFIDGTVVSGDKRGASLGFPTANLKTANELIPSNGVYACLAQIKTRKYPAVTNVGFNPTFGGKTLTIETHLLNFKRDIYRENIRLFFIKRIRGEQTFSSAAKLIHQIKKDIQSAKKYLNRQVSLKNGMYKRNFRFRTRQRG